MKNNISIALLASALFFASFFAGPSALAEVTLNPNCIIEAGGDVNFSNGTSIFISGEYDASNLDDANLTIFLGDDVDVFCDNIGNDLEGYLDDLNGRVVVFTPEFLVALQSGGCSDDFDDYFDNFKKSGDLLDDSGTAFCALTDAELEWEDNPDGAYFDYPDTGDTEINDKTYNKRDIKRYSLAHLMNNPNSRFTGVVKLFAEAINSSLFCGDYDNANTFFNAAKSDYNNKHKNKFLDVDYSSGELLEPADGIPGIFGWLLTYALGDANVPIIKAAELSDNVYLCSLEELEDYYIEDAELEAGETTTIDAEDEIGVVLEINAAEDAYGRVEVAEYDENPASDNYNLEALGRFIGISTAEGIDDALDEATIRIYYDQDDVEDAGLDEDTLVLGYYNEDSDEWVMYDGPEGGVDKEDNYAWAETDHFSIWGIFGEEESGGGAGGAGGGGGAIKNVTSQIPRIHYPIQKATPSITPTKSPSGKQVPLTGLSIEEGGEKIPLGAIAIIMIVSFMLITAITMNNYLRKRKKYRTRVLRIPIHQRRN